eukprot:Colp12_sorted_trinity150504_noHs@9670
MGNICSNCFGEDDALKHQPLRDLPSVCLDNTSTGPDVVLVKAGRRLCGTGGVLANAPLVQNKSYFEIKLQSNGNYSFPCAFFDHAPKVVHLRCLGPWGCDKKC